MSNTTDLEWAEMLDEAQGELAECQNALRNMVMAAMSRCDIPANRIRDDEYLYDEMGSELGTATIAALAMMRKWGLS